MKRQKFKASIWRVAECLGEAEAFAHNSGIRKSEGLVRQFARDNGVIMHGDTPYRDENGYTRAWKSADGTLNLMAVVIPV